MAVSTRPNLKLVTPTEPAAQLPPAECDQLARQPYIPQWMIDEGEAHLRAARGSRRLRWAIGAMLAAAWLSAAVALWQTCR